MYLYHREAIDAATTLEFHRREHRPLVHPALVQVGRLVSKGKRVMQPHVHRTHEFIQVRRGVYRCWVNGDRLTLGLGDILILTPGDSHRDEYRPGLDFHSLYFEFTTENRVPLPDLCLLKAGLPAAAHRLRLPRLLSRLDGALLPRPVGPCDEAALEGTAVSWLWSAVGSIPRRFLSESFASLLDRQELGGEILSYLRGQVTGRPSVAEMARALGMGESAFAHACTRLLGHSPRVLLEQVKMTEGLRLLTESREKVEAIAQRLGYSNPFHFSRAFKKVTGKAPVHFRKAQH
ncbi:MAG: helix-turn-helix transcriptional regulator [Spirochaetes bacterium]|nr:helix-turn-helix transcriptional regulator [Spirochaetota bacterium]